jgi:putative transposase
MNAHSGTFRVTSMSRVLKVSRSGFYAWRKRQGQPSARQQRREHMDEAVKKAFEARKGRSGSPGLTQDLPSRCQWVSVILSVQQSFHSSL